MRIEFTAEAEKDWQRIGHAERIRIAKKLDVYAALPDALRHQVKKLKGVDALRLRVGDYRILFAENGTVLRVLRIGHRREIYR